MIKIGCHLSASKGFEHMLTEALSIGGNTFQFFTRNPRGGQAKEINIQDINIFIQKTEIHHFNTILAHASYTLNPASNKEEIRQFARDTMKDDLLRMEYIPGQLYNFHPGCHMGQGIESGIFYIINLLNDVLKPEQTTTVLLETMSGKGSEIGSRFEEIRAIIDGVCLKEKMGVCLDTCHVYSAGYDLVNDLEGVLTQFDRVIGIKWLKAIHLNDSLTPFNSHKDRHAKIGEGTIGKESIIQIINHPLLKDIPFFLETPNELPGYKAEIQLLKEHYYNQLKEKKSLQMPNNISV